MTALLQSFPRKQRRIGFRIVPVDAILMIEALLAVRGLRWHVLIKDREQQTFKTGLGPDQLELVSLGLPAIRWRAIEISIDQGRSEIVASGSSACLSDRVVDNMLRTLAARIANRDRHTALARCIEAFQVPQKGLFGIAFTDSENRCLRVPDALCMTRAPATHCSKGTPP